MNNSNKAVQFSVQPTATYDEILSAMRQQLDSASMVATLLFDKFIGGEKCAFERAEDPFNCYQVAGEMVNNAFILCESLQTTIWQDLGDYSLKILYVRDYLRLLASKAGCSDFDRCSVSGLADQLVENLRNELENYNQTPA